MAKKQIPAPSTKPKSPRRRIRLRECYQSDLLEAGTDEAGRGCLAGPVTAAAVILPPGFHHPLLNDSKQLDHEEREILRPIIEREALAWAVSFVSPAKIDRINILNASILAMHRALERLEPCPGFVAVDGNRFKPWRKIPFETIIQGDGKYRHIAAASVLAKTHRDERMLRLHRRFPDYGWETNMGYPTVEHRQALVDLGPTEHHRRTFRLTPPPQQGVLFD